MLGVSPFDESVLSLSNARLDFIMDMFSKDNPKTWKFHKTQEQKQNRLKIGVEWDNVLDGVEYRKFVKTGYQRYILGKKKAVERANK